MLCTYKEAQRRRGRGRCAAFSDAFPVRGDNPTKETFWSQVKFTEGHLVSLSSEPARVTRGSNNVRRGSKIFKQLIKFD